MRKGNPNAQSTSAVIGIARKRTIKSSFDGVRGILEKLVVIDPSAIAELNEFKLFEKNISALGPKNVPLNKINEYIGSGKILFDKIKNRIHGLQSIDPIQTLFSEHSKLKLSVDKVNDHPPVTKKAIQDSHSSYSEITQSLGEIRICISNNSFEESRRKLKKLKTDILHKYESFFRLSQIPRNWKSTVIEECRENIDHILACIDIMSGEIPLNPENDFDSILEYISSIQIHKEQNPIIPPSQLKQKPLELDKKIVPKSRSLTPRVQSTNIMRKPTIPITPRRVPQTPTKIVSGKEHEKNIKKNPHPVPSLAESVSKLPYIKNDVSMESDNEQVIKVVSKMNKVSVSQSPTLMHLHRDLNGIELSECDNHEKEFSISNCSRELSEIEKKLYSYKFLKNAGEKHKLFSQQIKGLKSEMNSPSVPDKKGFYIRLLYDVSKIEDEIAQSKSTKPLSKRIIIISRDILSFTQRIQNLLRGEKADDLPIEDQYERIINKVEEMYQAAIAENQEKIALNIELSLQCLNQIKPGVLKISRNNSVDISFDQAIAENNELKQDLKRFKNNLSLMNETRTDDSIINTVQLEGMTHEQLVNSCQKMFSDLKKTRMSYQKVYENIQESSKKLMNDRTQVLSELKLTNNRLILLSKSPKTPSTIDEMNKLTKYQSELIDKVNSMVLPK